MKKTISLAVLVCVAAVYSHAQLPPTVVPKATKGVTTATKASAVQNAVTNAVAKQAANSAKAAAATRVPKGTSVKGVNGARPPLKGTAPYVDASQRAFVNLQKTVSDGLAPATGINVSPAIQQAHKMQKLAQTLQPIATSFEVTPVDIEHYQRFYYLWDDNEEWEYDTLWKELINKDGKAPLMVANYQKYVGALQQVTDFSKQMQQFITQHAEGKMAMFGQAPADLLTQLHQVRRALNEAVDAMIVADPAVLRANQYLQNMNFYLQALSTGKLTKTLPETDFLVKESGDPWGFYLGTTMKTSYQPQARKVEHESPWFLTLAPGASRVQTKALPDLPKKLRVAVFDEDSTIRDAFSRMSEDPQAAQWEIKTFDNPEEFLAQPDHLFYDIVIGDFAPYAPQTYMAIPNALQKANFSGLVLSCTDANPAAWTAGRREYIGERETWIQFAKESKEVGIDGYFLDFINLQEAVKARTTSSISGEEPVPAGAQVVWREPLNPKNLVRQIKAAYWTKGGGKGAVLDVSGIIDHVVSYR